MCICVARHAWCMYVYMYVLTSIFMQAVMHKSIHVSMRACMLCLGMLVHMYESKNSYVFFPSHESMQ